MNSAQADEKIQLTELVPTAMNQPLYYLAFYSTIFGSSVSLCKTTRTSSSQPTCPLQKIDCTVDYLQTV
jgi:hypothetical protein